MTFLPPCGAQGLNSCPQVWLKVPLPAEPTHQPCAVITAGEKVLTVCGSTDL